MAATHSSADASSRISCCRSTRRTPRSSVMAPESPSPDAFPVMKWPRICDGTGTPNQPRIVGARSWFDTTPVRCVERDVSDPCGAGPPAMEMGASSSPPLSSALGAFGETSTMTSCFRFSSFCRNSR